MKRLVVILTLIAVLLIGVAGCRHNVDSTNPVVINASALLDAANTTKTISDGLTAANSTIERLKATEPEYYAAAKVWLKRVRIANDHAIADIRLARKGNTVVNWRNTLLTVSTEAASFSPITYGFKNPTTQSYVELGLSSFVAILSSLPQKFGSS